MFDIAAMERQAVADAEHKVEDLRLKLAFAETELHMAELKLRRKEMEYDA